MKGKNKHMEASLICFDDQKRLSRQEERSDQERHL